MRAEDLIQPDWPAPSGVRAWVTTRLGGVSTAPYDQLNLADHVGDAPEAVAANRARLLQHVPGQPCWLNQVHGKTVVTLTDAPTERPQADAALTRTRGVVCAVLTADCLPVLLCDRAGSVVAAVHAGWRGLAAGVIERTVEAMACPPDQLMAWLGPAIGPQAFEVGPEVREAFVQPNPAAAAAFSPGRAGKWQADLFKLARQRLASLGVAQVLGGGVCTVRDAARFYSYRRDGVTGRFASLIWLA